MTEDPKMYLVIFLNQDRYEFVSSLHPTRAEAELAFVALMREHNVCHAPWGDWDYAKDGLPPKTLWHHRMADANGEEVHMYTVGLDGERAEELYMKWPDEETTAGEIKAVALLGSFGREDAA
jgi:hypothetical protein